MQDMMTAQQRWSSVRLRMVWSRGKGLFYSRCHRMIPQGSEFQGRCFRLVTAKASSLSLMRIPRLADDEFDSV